MDGLEIVAIAMTVLRDDANIIGAQVQMCCVRANYSRSDFALQYLNYDTDVAFNKLSPPLLSYTFRAVQNGGNFFPFAHYEFWVISDPCGPTLYFSLSG